MSTAVGKAVEGFEREATPGTDGQRQLTLEDVVGSEELDVNHLIVSAYQQVGALPADTPDLDAVTDHAGQVSALDSFRDSQPDPDVTGNDVGPQAALAQIARHGPAGENPQEWRDAQAYYRSVASLRGVDVEHANPGPLVPLGSGFVGSARRSDRYGDRIPWPLANPMTFPPDTSTPAR